MVDTSSPIYPASCWRRGFYSACPEDWQTNFIIWQSVFLSIFAIEFIACSFQLIYYVRAFRKMPSDTRKENMKLILASLTVLTIDSFMFTLMCSLSLITEGKPYAPIFVELLITTPYALGSLVLAPVFLSWMRVISKFTDSPVAKSLTRIRFRTTPVLKFALGIYLIIYFLVYITTAVVSAISDDYYFTALRAQFAFTSLHNLGLATYLAVLGFSVINIFRLSELSSQDAGSTQVERALTLKYMKSQVRSILIASLSFFLATGYGLYAAAQYEVFDVSEVGCLVWYSLPRTSGVLGIPSMLSGFGIYYWVILHLPQRVRSMTTTSRRNTTTTPVDPSILSTSADNSKQVGTPLTTSPSASDQGERPLLSLSEPASQKTSPRHSRSPSVQT